MVARTFIRGREHNYKLAINVISIVNFFENVKTHFVNFMIFYCVLKSSLLACSIQKKLESIILIFLLIIHPLDIPHGY